MKKIISFFAIIFSLSVFFISCQKSAVPSANDIQSSVYPISFLTIENATDSGTVANVSYHKTGYTAIIQRNYFKDNSAVDSLKIRYEKGTTFVDSLVLASPTPTTITVIPAYQDLATLYYNFTLASPNFVTGTKYTVVATIYTDKGNFQTATFSNLFTW